MITDSCVRGTQGAKNTPLHVPVMHDAGVTAVSRLVIECAVVPSAVAVRSVACNAGMEGHAGICPPSFAIRTQQSRYPAIRLTCVSRVRRLNQGC